MHPHPASRVTSLWARRFLIAVFILLLLLLGTGIAAAAKLFPDPVFPVGPQPVAVAAADFNGDGKIDLATANSLLRSISILLSRGNGEFEPARGFPMGDQPTWLAAADFNADGKVDLAVTESANSMSIFLDDGHGNFVRDDQYPVGDTSSFTPSFVVAADLNLDGIQDLAVASQTSEISVFLGKGDGKFHPATHFQAGGGALSLAVVDFNQDGFPDLAVSTAYEAFEGVVLYGHGDGQFDAPVPLGGGTGGYFIITADFNGDAHPDLAVSDFYLLQASVLLGDGHGGILRRVVIDSFPLSAGWLGSSDFNGDGSPDLATSVGLAFGHGNGDFDPLVPFLSLPAGAAIADLDDDGFPDLAAANDEFTGGVIVLLNDRQGRLGPRVYTTENRAGLIAKGDFTGDGLIDLAGASYFADFIVILPGRADGTFEPEIQVPAAEGIGTFVSGDFDGDGRLDLAYSNPFSSFVSVLRGHGDGSFEAPVDTYLNTGASILVTGDFNADGRTDLVALRYSRNGVQVLLGKPDGTFEVIGPVGPAMAAWAAAVGDLNADGRQDLVAAYTSIDSVTVLLGNGDGTFETGGTYGAGDHLFSLAVGDLNGDGKVDLAAGHALVGVIGPPAAGSLDGCCDAIGRISVLLGQGDGTLGEEHRYAAGLDRHNSIDIADFDHDGHPDLLTSGAAILFGAGDGTFWQPRRFAHFGPGVIEDFNHDGWPDIAVAHLDIVVDLNRGAGPGRLAAHAHADAEVECTSLDGTEVVLDGSTSIGDIELFEWFENFGHPGMHLLGTGETLHAMLHLGPNHITLRVTDAAGAFATDTIIVSIIDTKGPTITVNITPNPLWPPNNKMVDVSALVRATDACGGSVDVKLASIQGEGFAPYGNGKFASNVGGADIGTADFSFQLRAVRAPSKQGAYYMVNYTATDAAGNPSSATGIVRIPHDHRDIPKKGPGQVPIP